MRRSKALVKSWRERERVQDREKLTEKRVEGSEKREISWTNEMKLWEKRAYVQFCWLIRVSWVDFH